MQTVSSFIRSFYHEADIDLLIKALEESPMETIIRVNTIKSTMEECVNYLQNNLSRNFLIEPHSLVPNIISIVQKEKEKENDDDIREESKRHDKWIVVHSDCYQSLKRGANLYSPGIIAMHKNIHRDDLVSIYTSNNSNNNNKVLSGQISRPSDLLWIANGIFQMTDREEWISGNKIMKRGLAVKLTGSYHPSLNEILNDKMFCQNLPSILAVESMLPIEDGMWVLDMCAAPGGKTTHLGQYTKMGINLIALDKNKSKVTRLKDTMNKMGIVHGECMVMDAAKYNGNGRLFDRILLDAPCSALGQRPTPINNTTINSSDIDGIIKHQESLFYQAVKLLKPGGVMVYSTCTINPQENEYLILRMCDKFRKEEGGEGEGESFLELIEPSNVAIKSPSPIDPRMQLFLPHFHLDTIGFFYAKLLKKKKKKSKE